MTITSIGVYVVKGGPMGLLAHGYVTFENNLRCNHLQLWQTSTGNIHLEWPRPKKRRLEDNQARPFVHPCTKDFDTMVASAMFEEYKKQLGQPSTEVGDAV